MKTRQRHAQTTACAAAALFFIEQTTIHNLRHPMLRPHHDWTQWHEVRCCCTAIVHHHSKETRCAKGFCGRRDLLDMPADRLFTFVDTKHRLKRRTLLGFDAAPTA